MSLHQYVNSSEAYRDDAAHTIERVRALVPDDPHRYDEARARAIKVLGERYLLHRANHVLGERNLFANVVQLNHR
jgi:predicted Ser/Thr protein kinase